MTKRVRVPLHNKPQGFATVDDGATRGAVLGQTLFNPDGSVVTLDQLGNVLVTVAQSVNVLGGGGVNQTPSVTLWELVQDIPSNVREVAELATDGLVVRLADGNWITRDVVGTAGRIAITNGDAQAGDPTIDLATVANTGVGAALVKITRDAYGRVEGTAAATTTDLPEGSNLYYTDGRADARAAAAVAAHVALADPHPQYLTSAEGAAAYQPIEATLTALAGANWAANALPIGTGVDTLSQTSFAANTFPARASTGNLVAKTITDFGLSLVDDADASAGRSTLGLGTMAVQNANAVAITGGTILGADKGHFGSSSGADNAVLAYKNNTVAAMVVRQDNVAGTIAAFQSVGANRVVINDAGITVADGSVTTVSTANLALSVKQGSFTLPTLDANDTAVIARSSNCLLSMFTDRTLTVGITFGDQDERARGAVVYLNPSDALSFRAGASTVGNWDTTRLAVTGALSATSTVEAGKSLLIADVYQISSVSGDADVTVNVDNGAVQTLQVNGGLVDLIFAATSAAGKAGLFSLAIYNVGGTTCNVNSNETASGFFNGEDVSLTSVGAGSTREILFYWDGFRALQIHTTFARTGDARPT